MTIQDTPAVPVPSGAAEPSPAAIGLQLAEPARRFLSHQDEIDPLVRNPINQARLLLFSLITTNRTVGAYRSLHTYMCGCLHYQDCPSKAASHQRDATIRAAQVEAEIRGYLDMAEEVGA